MLKRLALIVYIFLMCTLLIGCNSSETGSMFDDNTTDPEELYIQFEHDLINAVGYNLIDEDAFYTFEDAMLEGKVDILTMYEKAKNYQERIRNRENSTQGIKVNDKLPEKAKVLIDEGKDNILGGMSMRALSLTYLLDYLDSGKASDLANYNEHRNSMYRGMKYGFEKLSEAREELGIKNYLSPHDYEVIYRSTEGQIYYYILQKGGEVTAETATSILSDLYYRLARGENPEFFAGAEIFDSTQPINIGERPVPGEAVPSVSYTAIDEESIFVTETAESVLFKLLKSN